MLLIKAMPWDLLDFDYNFIDHDDLNFRLINKLNYVTSAFCVTGLDVYLVQGVFVPNVIVKID